MLNKKPIVTSYKGKGAILLGHKVRLRIKPYPWAQQLAFIALAVGLLEKMDWDLATVLPGGETMLKELLNEFTSHQTQYPEFDVDTMVVQNYRLKPGLYIRLNEYGGMDEFYVTKKWFGPKTTLCWSGLNKLILLAV